METGATRPNVQNTAARTEQVNRESRTRRQEDVQRQESEQELQAKIQKEQISKEQTVEATIVRIRESQAKNRSGNYIDVKI